jgi:hypothetical protein
MPSFLSANRRFSPGIDGIRDIPRAQRWEAERWNIGGNLWSLDQIEHVQIREHFRHLRPAQDSAANVLVRQLAAQVAISRQDDARH